MGAQAQPSIEGVNKLGYWIASEELYGAIFILSIPHLPQPCRRMLHLCFAAKLKKCLVHYETLLSIDIEVSRYNGWYSVSQ